MFIEFRKVETSAECTVYHALNWSLYSGSLIVPVI